MYEESKHFFHGTEFQDKWWFYHGALINQMSDKKTRKFAKDKGWLDHWLLPVNGCCAGTIYFNRPVGNTPEVMPWDESLNRDVHCCVNRYESMSRWIKKDEHPDLWHKRFTRTNQKQMLYSYMRVLDPVTGVCPSSHRIIQSITKCWGVNIDKIVEYKGAIVPREDSGVSRNGRRTVSGVSKRGGKRVKNEWTGMKVFHPHAQEIWERFRIQSESKFESSE